MVRDAVGLKNFFDRAIRSADPVEKVDFFEGMCGSDCSIEKVGIEELFFDCVRMPDLVSDRKSPFSIDQSDCIRIGLTRGKSVTIRDISAQQNITTHYVSFLTKIADMPRFTFVSRVVIFSHCEKSNISNPTVLWVGPTLAGGAEPGRADRARPNPCSAKPVIFSNHEPKTDLVCEIPIPRNVGPARPASFQSHWLSPRPGP